MVQDQFHAVCNRIPYVAEGAGLIRSLHRMKIYKDGQFPSTFFLAVRSKHSFSYKHPISFLLHQSHIKRARPNICIKVMEPTPIRLQVNAFFSTFPLHTLILKTLRIWYHSPEPFPMQDIINKGLDDVVLAIVVLQGPNTPGIPLPYEPTLVDLAVCPEGITRILNAYGCVEFCPLTQ